MTEWCTTQSMAAAVAMGLAKMRSRSEGPGALVFGDEREEHLGLRDTPRQVAQVVEEQSKLPSLRSYRDRSSLPLAARSCCTTGMLRPRPVEDAG